LDEGFLGITSRHSNEGKNRQIGLQQNEELLCYKRHQQESKKKQFS
jgi:hypothetical protein